MNWHVSGASALSETVAARSSSLVAQRPDGGRGRRAVPPQQLERRLFRDGVVLLGVRGVHVVNHVPGHAHHRLAPREGLRQLDLDRVHGRDVMDDDADLAPVMRNPGLPLRVGEGARRGRRGRSRLVPGARQERLHVWSLGVSLGRWNGCPSRDACLDVEIFTHHRGRPVGGEVVPLEQPGELVAEPARPFEIGRPQRRDRGPVAGGEQLGDGRRAGTGTGAPGCARCRSGRSPGRRSARAPRPPRPSSAGSARQAAAAPARREARSSFPMKPSGVQFAIATRPPGRVTRSSSAAARSGR